MLLEIGKNWFIEFFLKYEKFRMVLDKIRVKWFYVIYLKSLSENESFLLIIFYFFCVRERSGSVLFIFFLVCIKKDKNDGKEGLVKMVRNENDSWFLSFKL